MLPTPRCTRVFPVPDRARFAALALPGLLVALSACVSTPIRAQMPEPSAPPLAFIEVSGTGQVSVTPDRGVVSLAVETEAPTADQASQQNAERMERVLQAVRGTRMEGLQLATFGYQLHPVYRNAEKPDDQPRIVAYRALNFLRAEAHDPGRVGRIIDAAIGAGANRITGVEFRASDLEPARLQALEIAIARAQAQAETMARALGVPLGPVLEVHGGADGGPPMRAYAAREMMMADTPIEVGDQQVSATVTVRFALQPHPDR